MSSRIKDLEYKIDQVLSDSFLKQFATDNFDPSEFIGSQLTSNNIGDLWTLYHSLMEKDKSIDACLELLVEQDANFFNNQFTMPREYGVS